MSDPFPIRADADYAAAIRAVAGLFETLRLPSAFVGTIARSAWMGTTVESGSVDVLATLSPERMRQVPMMANQRGFRVDPREIERTEELDLIPLNYPAGGREIRIHVLMASNALYGRMLAESATTAIDGLTVRVVTAEDLALLLLMAQDDEVLDQLMASRPEFDLEALNRKLVAIGLGKKRIVP